MLTRLQILELLVFFLDELRRKIGRERLDAVMIRDVSSAKWWSSIRESNSSELMIGCTNTWIDISDQQIVFFTRGDNLANLNRVMLYIKDNEHTDRVKVVTVIPDECRSPENWQASEVSG